MKTYLSILFCLLTALPVAATSISDTIVDAREVHRLIVTQDSTVFERDVDYVNLPTTLGSIGVLANHAAMVCALADGRVRCTYENGGASEIDIGAGIAEVADNQVTLLVSDAKLKQ